MRKIGFVGVLLVTVLLVIGACASTPSGAPRVTPAPAPAPPPTPPTPPSAPSGLTADAVSHTQVKLHWFDNSHDEDGFKLYRDNRLMATLPADTSAYQDTDLKAGTTYKYTVNAYNQAGESEASLCSVRTPNPPIIVRLERIGVYHNGEHWLRGEAGEVYVGIIVTDGNTTVEKRFPPGEGQFYKLCRNEIVDVGATIFSVDEVGDYLRIAAVGYEDDGGLGEMLLYQALGAAAEAYISGGAASLLEMTDFSLGNILAKLFGAEDDWLGSYENSWGPGNDWGIGRYTDIACEEEDGTLGLRLWFTIESLLKPPAPSQAPAPALEPVPPRVPSGTSAPVILTDSFQLGALDIEAFNDRYGFLEEVEPCQWSKYIKNTDYGIYVSECFFLDANESVEIVLRSNSPVVTPESEMMETVRIAIRDSDFIGQWFSSYECQKIGHDMWETRCTFSPAADSNSGKGSYFIEIWNWSGQSSYCEYSITLK